MSNTITKIGKTYFEGAMIDEKVTKKKVNEIIDSLNNINDKGTVTQTGFLTTAVTLDKPAGVITTVSASTVAGSNEAFTVNNSYVTANSVIQLSVDDSATAGLAKLNIQNLTNGSFEVNVTNIHPTNAFNNIIKIYFLVI